VLARQDFPPACPVEIKNVGIAGPHLVQTKEIRSDPSRTLGYFPDSFSLVVESFRSNGPVEVVYRRELVSTSEGPLHFVKENKAGTLAAHNRAEEQREGECEHVG
jgi:hypothetical protein